MAEATLVHQAGKAVGILYQDDDGRTITLPVPDLKPKYKQQPHPALDRMKETLKTSNTAQAMVLAILETPHTLAVITGLITRQDAIEGNTITDEDEIRYKLINMEDEGYITYNTTTNKYSLNEERYTSND